MMTYRAYRVADFVRQGAPFEIEANSDTEAITKAEQLLDGVELLLWQGTRFDHAENQEGIDFAIRRGPMEPSSSSIRSMIGA